MLEPDPVCPKCGTEMPMLGEDVSEQLARVAAAFKVIRTIRPKMLCPSCGHIEQPPLPGLPIERSIVPIPARSPISSCRSSRIINRCIGKWRSLRVTV
ncbi:MAG: IS66 family transposase zinc-finger binding domain-containing protein [Burkholderia sp.]